MMTNKSLLVFLLLVLFLEGSYAFLPHRLTSARTTTTQHVLFAATPSFVGPIQESVKQILQKEFSPTYLQVINESHGNVQDESHFKVIIVSDVFQDKRLVQRHRLINSALMQEKDDGSHQLPFHALTITAKTTMEWETDNHVPDSPACMGGGGKH